jgi:hypothetical protein
MAKRQSQPELPDGGRGPAQKAILFEITGNERSEKRAGDELRMHRMAALSLEEVIRYMRVGHPDFEIAGVEVIGVIRVLSSSEHLV